MSAVREARHGVAEWQRKSWAPVVTV